MYVRFVSSDHASTWLRKTALLGSVSGTAKLQLIEQARTITFGRGRVSFGGAVLHSYASVSIATAGNSSRSAL
jgi:hypothetical protein